MSLSFKPVYNGATSTTPKVNINYEAIANALEEGNNPARISLIVDLGIQQRGQGVKETETTVFKTQEEAGEWFNKVKSLVGEKAAENLRPYVDASGQISADGAIYDKRDCQEVAIFADLTETKVVYVDGEPAKQYRVLLNKTFKKELSGFPFMATPPKEKGGVWSFAANSFLSKLSRCTGHPEILDGGEHNMDISRCLNEPLYVDLKKSGNFVNVGGISAKRKSETFSELDNTALLITFDTVTPELLEKAKLRKVVIDKIKQAVNYEGSAMQAALSTYEEKYKTTSETVGNESVLINDDPF